ncbi:hypothetical protein [Hymenobacter wooponensis]|uniref:Uncharacterized protein n=1 Tax=Hymenobacter wooponensis TaxID=1525360 RepID=A0A4Z0MK03_9BACT|nr:hypothetical protein [Hymenobacter wooponensis]TGD79637.1 hypothetical protein EU557_15575 [Hymenobacter wooponensis]
MGASRTPLDQVPQPSGLEPTPNNLLTKDRPTDDYVKQLQTLRHNKPAAALINAKAAAGLLFGGTLA